MAFTVTQEMLDEAQEAYRQLMMGGSVVEFRDQNSERIVYAKADANKLLNYINWLKSELGIAVPFAGPMRVWM